MRYATISMTIILLAVVSPSHGQNWAEKMFATRSHDFGYVPRDAKAEFAFVMKNTYMGDIHIAGVHSSCVCATPRIEKQLLKTYEQTAIVAKLNTERLRGRQSSTITVRIDKPARASVQLHIKAFIYDAVTFDPSAVQFGSVVEGTAAEETVAVTYRRGTQWKIREVQSASPLCTLPATSGCGSRRVRTQHTVGATPPRQLFHSLGAKSHVLAARGARVAEPNTSCAQHNGRCETRSPPSTATEVVCKWTVAAWQTTLGRG